MRPVTSTLIAAVGFLLAATTATAEEVSDYDRFQLWNKCRPMELVVPGLTGDAIKLGVTEAAITVAARSRLRAARLYTEDTGEAAWSDIIVYANVFAGAITVGAEYRKIVTDAATEFIYPTVTWKVLSTGMHGHRADFILSHVTGKVDLFIDEYLRVNEAACR